MQYLERIGHYNDPNDLTSFTVEPGECVAETAATCVDCLQETKTHLSLADYTMFRKAFRDRWALGFWTYAGWETTVGLCGTCLSKRRRN